MKTKIDLQNKTVLVTGSSGFIGSALCKRLLNEVDGITVIGIDNMNDYYDIRIKEQRLCQLFFLFLAYYTFLFHLKD